MKKSAFSGGILFDKRSNDLKKLFKIKERRVVDFTPEKVTIPFDQHIGASNELVVNIGDIVLQGEVIAKSPQDISGHVHASMTGTVTAITEIPSLNGNTQRAVVIEKISAENSSKHNVSEKFFHEDFIPEDFPPEKAIRQGGIVGLGGATFPTHIKLSAGSKPVDYLILNGTECEPFIVSDDFLMEKESEKILQGALIVKKILSAKEILIGIEEDKPLAIAAMSEACKNISNCKVIALPVIYPQGGEGQLIESLINREIPQGSLPIDTGAVVINVATSFAIYESVAERKSLTHRYVTVTGDVKNPQVIRFPFGTSCEDLINFCGGTIGKIKKIIHGGPMMGKLVTDLKLPLTKGSNGLIILNADHADFLKENPCIRCNRCVLACPVRLEPQNIDLAYRNDDLFSCDQLRADACINCGCCTYVCPAKRNLAGNIYTAGQKVKQIRRELAKNES